MLYNLFIFLPMAACLFWMILFRIMAFDTRAYHALMTLLFISTLYLFADGCYNAPDATSGLLMYTNILAMVTASSIIPLAWEYMRRLEGAEMLEPFRMIWLIFPAGLGAAVLSLTIVAGPERVQGLLDSLYPTTSLLPAPSQDLDLHLYYITCAIIERLVLLLEAILYGAQMAFILRKENVRWSHLPSFFKGEQVRVFELQAFALLLVTLAVLPKAFLRHGTLVNHPWIPVLISVLITCALFPFCHIALFNSRERISRREIAHAFLFNYNASDKEDVVAELMTGLVDEAEDDALRRIQGQIDNNLHLDEWLQADSGSRLTGPLAGSIFSAVAKSWDEDSLPGRFQRLMLQERAYLEPGLTLLEVADRLNSNKTYVSRMVNNTYNLAFPDLINTLRIDYAQQYIIAHRNAKQTEIAAASGFTSASSFNNMFKKVTGATPKIWMAAISRRNPSTITSDLE